MSKDLQWKGIRENFAKDDITGTIVNKSSRVRASPIIAIFPDGPPVIQHLCLLRSNVEHIDEESKCSSITMRDGEVEIDLTECMKMHSNLFEVKGESESFKIVILWSVYDEIFYSESPCFFIFSSATRKKRKAPSEIKREVKFSFSKCEWLLSSKSRPILQESIKIIQTKGKTVDPSLIELKFLSGVVLERGKDYIIRGREISIVSINPKRSKGISSTQGDVLTIIVDNVTVHKELFHFKYL